MNKYIKVVTGFREDQYESIDAEEAHKAYYLFLNPEERGIFSNGVALIGKNIQSIKPDYHKTMGYNPSHVLEDDDWVDITDKGIRNYLEGVVREAKEIAIHAPNLISLPFTEARKQANLPEPVNRIGSGAMHIGDFLPK